MRYKKGSVKTSELGEGQIFVQQKKKKFLDYKLSRRRSYYLLHPIKFLRDLFRMVQRFYLRGKYGWCYYDWSDMDKWFCKVVPEMLIAIADNHVGYPYKMSSEEWEVKLNTAANKLIESSKCYDIEYTTKDKIEEDKEKFALYEKAKDEALDFLKQYFYDLWD